MPESKPTSVFEQLHVRFVQLVVANDALFGLDDKGAVYRFVEGFGTKPARWIALPPGPIVPLERRSDA